MEKEVMVDKVDYGGQAGKVGKCTKCEQRWPMLTLWTWLDPDQPKLP